MSKRADARLDRTAWPGRASKMASIADTDETTFRSTFRRILESTPLTVSIADAVIVCAGYAGALLLRFGGDVPPESWQRFAYVLPFIAAAYLLANMVFGGYRAGWRYSVFKDVGGLLIGVTLVTVVVFGVNSSFSHRDIPLSVNLLGGALMFLGMWAVRGWPQLVEERAHLFSESQVPPKATAISAVQRAALGVAAVLTLDVGVWIVIQLAQYEPSTTDDMRVIYNASQFLQDSSSWFESQAPLLQYFTYISLIKLFGWDAPLVLVPLLFSAALALLVGYIARQVTGGGLWAFLAAVLLMASLPIFLAQAHALSFYSPALFFGYAGVFAAAAYARYGGRGALAAGALGLAAALYSYSFGVLFLLIPVLYVLIDHSRPVLGRLGRIYAIVAALVTPWFVWHLAAQGLDGLFRQRQSWMVDRGYLQIRNVEFLGLGSDSRLEFMEKLPDMLYQASGPLIFLLVALSIVGLIRLRTWSWRAAALAALAIPIGALLMKTPAAYGRYVYILLPGLVVLSVYGFHGLLQPLSSYPRTAYLSAMAGIVALGLLGTALLHNAPDEVDTERDRQSGPVLSELALIAGIIDDGKAVIGSRATKLILYEDESRLLNLDFMAEEDFVTYLSWPSDEAVAQMFARNNVGWALVQQPVEQWERDYHVWLREAAGQLPQHYIRIENSSLAEKAYAGLKYSLYRVVGAEELAFRANLESAAR